ncbi:2'-5' RNA ligase family protein [Hydrogenophaga sp. OTU3427]|uniref:2'-5' RNA ligase family protein n=1 Tax=Hydrogenophaga sp. OTU3427 TaxID=3043856 RepID=UPI00313BD200
MTPGQLDLPGFEAPPPAAISVASRPRHNLFFALTPPLEVAQQWVDWTAKLCARRGLGGKAMRADLLHVSLHGVWSGETLVPLEVVELACEAGGRVRAAECPLTFDRVMSFSGSRGQPDRHPLVLRQAGGAGSESLFALHRRLGLALAQNGFRVSGSFTPHLTLRYTPGVLPEEATAPMGWSATSLVLIDSHVGASHHERLAEWPLSARA